MKINDVEQKLGISKANIRFYEKQGLLSPGRRENKYREYSEADIDRLKTIMILRKLGISVQNIGNILQGDIAFQDAIQENISELEAQIDQLQGALNLSRQIASEQEKTLDTARYWDIIQQKEAQGERFADTFSEYWRHSGFPLLALNLGWRKELPLWLNILNVIFHVLGFAMLSYLIYRDDNFLMHFLRFPILFLCSILAFYFISRTFKKTQHTQGFKRRRVILRLICVIIIYGFILAIVFWSLGEFLGLDFI